jgi:hypothetical protein
VAGRDLGGRGERTPAIALCAGPLRPVARCPPRRSGHPGRLQALRRSGGAPAAKPDSS